jgi:uncharacterized protein DUF2314
MAAPSKKKEKRPTKGPDRQKRNLWLLLGAVVVGLGVLVYWSLPRDTGQRANPGDPEAEPDSGEESEESMDAAARGTPLSTIARLPRATCEFAVITSKPDEVVRKTATAEAVSKLLDVKYCGATCEALKKHIAGEDDFEIEVTKTEEVILPPKDSLDTAAPLLSPAEREQVHQKTTAVVVRAQGPALREQIAARTAFAAAAALADALDGFVYDEASRRIDSSRDFVERRVTAALGEAAFAPRQIVVQLYRQEDGTARALTLGMARYGSPDLIARGSRMADGPLLVSVLNAVASQIVDGKNAAPITLGLEDVARANRQKPAELAKDPAASKAVRLDVVEPERAEGDPDNEIVEIVPEGGPSRTSWDEVLSSLFAKPREVVAAPIDSELAARARRGLPAAIRRFEHGDGALYLKGPFPIPPDARADGGPVTEYLWIAVASCDERSCKGSLSNSPAYADNLAAGKTTGMARTDVVDWVIRLRDGGLVGGDSIKALGGRR